MIIKIIRSLSKVVLWCKIVIFVPMKIEYIHLYILSIMVLLASGCSGAATTASQEKQSVQARTDTQSPNT